MAAMPSSRFARMFKVEAWIFTTILAACLASTRR
jgi:hypothetical protein